MKYEEYTAIFEKTYDTEDKKDEVLAVVDRFTNRQLAKSWGCDIKLVQALRKWSVGDTSY